MPEADMNRLAVYKGWALVVLPLLLASPVRAGEELSRAMMLSNSCMGCHGPQGVSPGSIPSIAGKSVEFLEQALKEFRSGKRSSTVMQRHARAYTDEEIGLLARYFADIKQ
jgi:sulfide dehydrogenase cytochrome subunit